MIFLIPRFVKIIQLMFNRQYKNIIIFDVAHFVLDIFLSIRRRRFIILGFEISKNFII